MGAEQTFKVVLVGCGDISRTWLKAAKGIPSLEIVGLVDLKEQAAREKAAQFGLTNALVGTHLKAVLGKVRPDFVFDCTTPNAHADVTLEALRHGCHVLGEKPMADTLDNARKMVAAAQETGKVYAVIQNSRYDHNIRRLKSFLESGAIGRINTVHSDFYIGAHFGGFREHMRHVLLVDMAIHTFDAARLITDADPISVFCKDWNPAGSWYDHGASAVAVFTMSDGIIYTYRGSWCAEGLNTSWAGEWRLIGENGSIKWDGNQMIQAQVVAGTGGFFSDWQDVDVPPYDGVAPAGGHAGLIRGFVRAIRMGTTPETICTDNIKSFAMVSGAMESAESGRSVAMEW